MQQATRDKAGTGGLSDAATALTSESGSVSAFTSPADRRRRCARRTPAAPAGPRLLPLLTCGWSAHSRSQRRTRTQGRPQHDMRGRKQVRRRSADHLLPFIIVVFCHERPFLGLCHNTTVRQELWFGAGVARTQQQTAAGKTDRGRRVLLSARCIGTGNATRGAPAAAAAACAWRSASRLTVSTKISPLRGVCPGGRSSTAEQADV